MRKQPCDLGMERFLWLTYVNRPVCLNRRIIRYQMYYPLAFVFDTKSESKDAESPHEIMGTNNGENIGLMIYF